MKQGDNLFDSICLFASTAKQGDNLFDSICLFACVTVSLSELSRLTYDLDIWYVMLTLTRLVL